MGDRDFSSFDQLDSIVGQALDLPAESRDDFLIAACQSDAELLTEATTILSLALDETSDLAPGAGLSAFASSYPTDESAPARAGERFGPWCILDEIGSGGMAKVYLAERADGAYEQQVAIKLLDRAGRLDISESRFEHERNVLARLQHPNIARLLDGGQTDDGRSYIVMEYVDGERIDRYCDRHAMSTGDRLKLFTQVCETVHFAHRQLIVHRDIKPGNILVTNDGTPKLLDFGIAKLLEPDSKPLDMTQTLVAHRLLTPQYASPEQILGEPVSTATDVHALGLLLYELLSGHRARIIDSTQPGAIERVICETQPITPSMACAIDHAAARGRPARNATEIAAARQLTPTRLRRRLRGDLDNIVMMALRREPERRYASAQQMADDIARHLARRPVSARPDSLTYRLDRYVRRHVAGISITAVAIAAVTSTTIYYTEQIAQQRDAAQLAAERARIESARAEQVSDFLTALFEASRPDEALGRELSARDLLDQGLERIEALEDEPEVQSRIISVIAKTHHRLGDYGRAESLYRRALTIRERHFGLNHPQLVESLNDLGVVLKDRGKLEAAEAFLRRAVDLRRALLGNSHEDLAISLEELGRLLREQGRLLEARSLFEEGLGIRRSIYGDRHSETLSSLNSVAMMQRDLGDAHSALELFRELVAGYRAVKGARHPWTASSMVNMAHALMDLERWQESVDLLESALSIERETLGADHVGVAITLNHLGTAYRERGELEQSRTVLQEAIQIGRAGWGERHPRLSGFLLNMGRTELALGRLSAAEQLLGESVAMHREFFPEPDWRTAEAEGWLGQVAAELGQVQSAERLMLDSHAALLESKGPGARQTRLARERIFRFYTDQGLGTKAERYRTEFAAPVSPAPNL